MEASVKFISIYGASSSDIDTIYVDEACKVGQLIARAGATLINGAGNSGLMKASTDGCIDAGGKAIGIIPRFMIEKGWGYDRMTEIIETSDIHIRQQQMSSMGDAAIVLPGGCGTLAELSELITWKQLGLYSKPLIILNTNHYYDLLLAQLKMFVLESFMKQEDLHLWRVATTAEEAVQLALSSPLWGVDA